MTLALWVLLACGIAYGTKAVGYLLPRHWLENPLVHRTSASVTVGLLAALTAVNAFTSGPHLMIDARLPALLAAAVALRLRAPYIVVVAVGAAAAAAARLLGMP